MPTRALVLSGGGPIGIAWESGIAAGMAEAGVFLGEADYTLGTSAGSFVGAQLASGRDPRSLVAAQLARAQGSGERSAPENCAPAPDLTSLMNQMMKLYTSDGPPEQARIEIGKFSLNANTMSEDAFIKTFGHMPEEWPSRAFACTAVDTATGEFQVWDNDSGVPLPRAVASSCSVPGVYPPITINGKRYMDGGMRSGTNADFARGYDRVLVVIVRAGAASAAPAGGPNMAEISQKRLDAELKVLTDSGSAVELLVPDADSAAAMGVNLMSFSARADTVQAGIAQGRIEAERLREFWA
jgi:NTE family protein